MIFIDGAGRGVTGIELTLWARLAITKIKGHGSGDRGVGERLRQWLGNMTRGMTKGSSHTYLVS